MAAGRCTLCGGKLNSSKICTECGMDNKKNDRHYRLNENLRIEPRMAENRSPDPAGGRKQAQEAAARRGFSASENRRDLRQYRQSYGKTAVSSRRSGNRKDGNTAGKIVFFVILLIVIGAAVVGFLDDYRRTQDEDSFLNSSVFQDEYKANEDGTYTIYSEDGHSAKITLMDGQIYCYGNEGYFSSMSEDYSGGEDFSYAYSFDEYSTMEEAGEFYTDYSWMEQDEDYQNITCTGVQVMDVGAGTACWSRLDYLSSGYPIRKINLWTKVGDILFTIEMDDTSYREDVSLTGTEDLAVEALSRVELR